VSPEYAAETEKYPAGSDDVVSTAAPEINATVAEPGVSVAVNVTDCPEVAGLGEEIIVVAVGAMFTDCMTVLSVYYPPPPYTAVIECPPVASAAVASAAVPPLAGAVPRTTEPSRNCTVPVAVFGVTAAVRVTIWEYTDGFVDELKAVVFGFLGGCTTTTSAGEVDV
jgi:hypothetical protein